ncbi:CAP domain-containing protein [Actinoplanes sp. OR16]|uniref:CAP domain-containing protein n=1 Tax=Actinoplanes sp. OR16 TaxID=946334 RepID=UPI000FDAA9E9|nr:CAP domain-containing protein [Actinoplanes sp. OR16]
MRKPLVVACVAAATLAAGGVTATALAQQSPDAPVVPDAQLFGERLLPDPDETVPPRVGTGTPAADPVAKSPAPKPSKPVPASSALASPALTSPASASEKPLSPKNRDKEEEIRPRRAAAEPGNPAGDVLDAARDEVSARDISDSPASPLQQQVLALVNRNRASHGCGSLTPDRRLIEAANRHAADMARRNYFAHEDSRGDRAGSRVADAGYEWKRYGENIARGQKSPFEVVTDWMNSPEHRENILDCRLDQMGVGLAIGADDTPYWVQDFATPR